ncbi:MAG: VOC family protein [Acidimicrobiales bacterium]
MPSPSRPLLQHLVLNVRDIEASERFYGLLGFEPCGKLNSPGAPGVDMRFYRGDEGHHHDLALVQIPNPEGAGAPPNWDMFTGIPGIAHFALAYPDRDSWLAQIEYLQNEGVEFAIRGNHGMTHSAYVVDPDGHGVEVLYDLPQEVWEGDVDAALSYFEVLPTTGPESLLDDNDYATFGTNQ